MFDGAVIGIVVTAIVVVVVVVVVGRRDICCGETLLCEFTEARLRSSRAFMQLLDCSTRALRFN